MKDPYNPLGIGQPMPLSNDLIDRSDTALGRIIQRLDGIENGLMFIENVERALERIMGTPPTPANGDGGRTQSPPMPGALGDIHSLLNRIDDLVERVRSAGDLLGNIG